MNSYCDVVIIGAGPYGLSAAAHLRAAGVETRIFGRTMQFWQQQMPAGMLLRSSWNASHISDPGHKLSLDDYQACCETPLVSPIPLDRFIEYGHWFKRNVAPDVDPRQVKTLELTGEGFRITLEDGQDVHPKCVVIAAGISKFAYKPPEFDLLPPPLVTHTSDHADFVRFVGRKVVVVGGGQSAIESAAILSETGADVEVIVRSPAIRWLIRSEGFHHLPIQMRRLLYHSSDVGPAFLSHLVARPKLFRLLSRKQQENFAYRAIRPAVSAWLQSRVANVPIVTGRQIIQVKRKKDAIELRLDNGEVREVDHVMLATGYRVDVSRYSFLTREVLDHLTRVNGYPELGPSLESSVRGLYFVGAAAAHSLGPLMRFVSGTDYASRALTSWIVRMPTRGFSPTEYSRAG